LNALDLTHILSELNALVGQFLVGAWQPDRERLYLGFSGGQTLHIGLDLVPRVYFVEKRPKNPSKPFSFQGLLRARLLGPLTAVNQVDDDLAFDLVFESGSLHVRLIPGALGIYLMSGADAVAGIHGPCPTQLAPLPPAPRPPTEPSLDPGARSWLRAAFEDIGEAYRQAVDAQRRRDVRQYLKREVKRARRLVVNLGKDLERIEGADFLRKQGDTLAANLHRIPKGASSVTFPDLEDPKIELEMALDPAVRPALQLDGFYRKARRLEAATDTVLQRVEDAEERLASLEAARDGLDEMPYRQLNKWWKKARPKTRRQNKRVAPWWTWRRDDGEIVFVGRNARGNRMLTFSRGKGSDVWMHLRNTPGSHLLIASKGRQGLPTDLLLEAGHIALATAKLAEGTAADVQYTELRHIRAIPGDTSGKVLVLKEKVLHLRRERDALLRWKRLDD